MSAHSHALPPRYADVRTIGHGGMGEILAAEDTELGRTVAVKLLAERFAEDAGIRARFEREALTAARLSGHPHIVTIFDVGEWAGRPYIVMEYLPGGTPAEHAREGRIDRDDALAWLGQAAAALDYAHEHGIVHRDVKPANLLLDERGEVKVGDFGIARVVGETTGGMTAAGTVIGTAGYLSPEQARGEPATAASDRYALGVVAYELLTGGRPFERGSATAEAAAHVHEPVPPASERAADLPRSVDSVLERALAKDPGARYPSAVAFVVALREAPAGGARTTRVLPAVPPPRRRRDRRSYVPALVAAVLLAAAAGGAVLATALAGGGDEEARPSTRRETVTIETRQTTTITRTIPAPTEPTNGGGDEELSLAEARGLNDQAFALMEQGNYEDALQLARRALARLDGTGDPYEAFANYNVGKSLIELGNCDEGLSYLDRSEELQGSRPEIDEAREQC